MMVSPIFLFSLPRSGSTLLQRMIAAHPLVATASETWLLLPFLYANKEHGIYTEYNHLAMREALNDFISILPHSNDDYYEALRSFMLDLYSRSAGSDKRYFLEKTPRYSLVIDEIFHLFPDAKFIFLWRNPVAITASSIETFGNGKWRLYDYKVDMFNGFSKLYNAFEKHKSHICSICYETLIDNPEVAYKTILNYLNLPYLDKGLTEFHQVELQGGSGDSIGTNAYGFLSKAPLFKWQKTLSNPLRKYWTLRYLNWIGRNRLKSIGYDYDVLYQQVKQLPSGKNNFFSDSIRIIYGSIKNLLEFKIFKDKIKLLSRWHNIHEHK